MANEFTTHMIDMYMEEAEPPMFLAGFFQSPPRDFYTSETVQLDIVRSEEDIAIVLQDLKAGGRENQATRYTNKEFTPPVLKEIGTISSYDLIKRRPGQIDFTDPNYGANAVEEAFAIARLLEAKIRRSIELMCAQVLQDGALTLKDETGVPLYTLDFQAKATHKATATTPWGVDGTTGDPLADLAALAQTIRRDGKRNPSKVILGNSALQRFIANEKVAKFLEKEVRNLGALAPETRGQGATFQGWIWLGNYRLELWGYDGYYKDPETGNLINYVDPNNAIMLSDGGRLDLTYGAIPRLLPPDPQIAAFLPERMSSSSRGLDLTLNGWVTENREHLKISVGTRPLPIPTAIDTFARLKVA